MGIPPQRLLQLRGWWNWKATYALLLLLVLVFTLIILDPFVPSLTPAATVATVVWGSLTLVLSLIFMLGAARTPVEFLVFFGTGVFGAGMGYLVGAWLTPTGDTNPLDQVRNIVAGVLTGVVGTKLLTLWDDLVDKPAAGGPPPIMTARYFVPIVMWLVGFTVSLSAFYTVRSQHSGNVSVTYAPKTSVLPLGAGHIGVLPEAVVRFSGSANSPDDVSVVWSFDLAEPCGTPVDKAEPFVKAEFNKEMMSTFNLETGKLSTPNQKVLQRWINSCPGSQNWVLTATSNENRAKSIRYDVKFCRTKQDCPAPTASAPGTSASGGSQDKSVQPTGGSQTQTPDAAGQNDSAAKGSAESQPAAKSSKDAQSKKK
jgi:hypothetical protein